MAVTALEMPARPHLIPLEPPNAFSKSMNLSQENADDLSILAKPISARDFVRMESLSIPYDHRMSISSSASSNVKTAMAPLPTVSDSRVSSTQLRRKETIFSALSKSATGIQTISEETIVRAPLLMTSIKRSGGGYVNRWEKEQLILQQNYLLFTTHTVPPTIVKCVDVRTIEKFEASSSRKYPLRRKLVIKMKHTKSGRKTRESSRIQSMEIKFSTLAETKIWDDTLKKRREIWINRTEIAREFMEHTDGHRMISKFKHEAKLAVASRFVASFSVILRTNWHATLQETFRRLHYNTLTRDASKEIELLQKHQLDVRKMQGMTLLQQIYSTHLSHAMYDFQSRLMHQNVNSERLMSRNVLVEILLKKTQEQACYIYNWRRDLLSKILIAVYRRTLSEAMQDMRRIAFQNTVLHEKKKQLLQILLNYRQLHRRELLQNSMVGWESYQMRQEQHIQVLANVLDNFLFHSMKKGFYCLYSHSLERISTRHALLLQILRFYQTSKLFSQRVGFFRWKSFNAKIQLRIASSICESLVVANTTLKQAYDTLPIHRGIHQFVFCMNSHTRSLLSMGWNAIKVYTYRMRLKQKLASAINILLIFLVHPLLRCAFNDLNQHCLTQRQMFLQRKTGCFHLQNTFRLIQKERLSIYWSLWLEMDDSLREEATKPSRSELLILCLEKWIQSSQEFDTTFALNRWRVYDERMEVMRDMTRVFCLHRVVGLADRLHLCALAQTFFRWKLDTCFPSLSSSSLISFKEELPIYTNHTERYSSPSIIGREDISICTSDETESVPIVHSPIHSDEETFARKYSMDAGFDHLQRLDEKTLSQRSELFGDGYDPMK